MSGQKAKWFVVVAALSLLEVVGEDSPSLLIQRTKYRLFLERSKGRDKGVLAAVCGKLRQKSSDLECFGFGFHAIVVIIMVSSFLLVFLFHGWWNIKKKSEYCEVCEKSEYRKQVEEYKEKFEELKKITKESLDKQYKVTDKFKECDIIWIGRFGTAVFEGKHGLISCAVKRMSKEVFDYAKVMSSMHKENLMCNVAIYAIEDDVDYIYISLEKGLADLKTIIEKAAEFGGPINFKDIKDFSLRRNGPYPSDAVLQIMRDIIIGVHNLHETGRYHGNLSPSNVLLFQENDVKGTLRAKLCDADMDWKTIKKSSVNSIHPDYLLSQGWLLSDVYNDVQSGKANDVFSVGCLLYYCLLGAHPFGGEHEMRTNIANKSLICYRSMDGVKEALDLLPKMLDIDSARSDNIITMSVARQHPLFWRSKDRLDFLAFCSDKFAMNSNAKPASIASAQNDLQRKTTFISRGWDLMVDLSFYQQAAANMQRSSGSYKTTSFISLLRFIRNQYRHLDDLGSFKHILGDSPEEFYTYFEMCFPGLLIETFDSMDRFCGGEDWFVRQLQRYRI